MFCLGLGLAESKDESFLLSQCLGNAAYKFLNQSPNVYQMLIKQGFLGF